MKIKAFHYGRELELNLVGRMWNFRIGTHQLALWRNYMPVFNFRRAILPVWIVALLSLGVISCAQIAAFHERSAPVIAAACDTFRKAEASPLVQLALMGGTMAANAASGGVAGPVVAEIQSYGRVFCLQGPPAGDATSPAAQASWLADVTAKLLGAAGAR